MIRTGAPGKSAVDIGRKLLHKFKSLRSMSGVDVSEFKKITGLKNAKIAQIKAAIELGRRMLSEEKDLEGLEAHLAGIFLGNVPIRLLHKGLFEIRDSKCYKNFGKLSYRKAT